MTSTADDLAYLRLILHKRDHSPLDRLENEIKRLQKIEEAVLIFRNKVAAAQAELNNRT